MKRKFEKTNPEISADIAEKLIKSNLEVFVSTANSSGIKTTIPELINNAKKENKSVIFTFTCGPFLSGAPLPTHWMNTPAVVGCTKQLQALDKAVADKGRLASSQLFCINRWGSDYQSRLITDKNLTKTGMISAYNKNSEEKESFDDLKKEFGLTTVEVNEEQYLARCHVAVRTDGTAQVFKLENSDPEKSINEEIIKTSIESIANFLGADLKSTEQKSVEQELVEKDTNSFQLH